ncbi:MAG TPA: cation diffusion facilitator family transporter [Planctomycetota bacterium]|nr:cation diffusion facilitator family transporter [Planctomycetota bacterium]
MSLQLIALLVNVALAAMKFTVGLLAGSRALIADAYNSAGDVFATFVAWIAFRIGQAPPDEDHHYGHENAEALAGLLVGGMLCATGGFICLDGVRTWFSVAEVEAPEVLAAWAALATAFTKEVLYRASIRVGRATHSPTLLASARDHRADVVTSLVAFTGIVAARYGHPGLDAAAGGVIGVYIFWLGIAPVRQNLRVLMGGAPPDVARMAAWHAARASGVASVARVQVLPMGGRYQVDLVIEVDGRLSVAEGHDIAHRAEDEIRKGMPTVTAVRVHVEPH